MTDDMWDQHPDAPAVPEALGGGDAPPPATSEATVAGEDTAGSGDRARDPSALQDALEALIFVHRGILPPKTVREVLGEEYTAEEIAAGLAALREEYASRGGALTLLEVAGGYQFGTRPDLAPWIQKLDFYENHRHLSRPTLETLAIIAYKQPVTRAEIEAIRGVNVERIVRTLIERKLVRILGHKDVPGRPMVIGTTKEFLELFGLNSLADLPPLKDFIGALPGEGLEEEPLPPSDVVRPEDAEGIAGEGTGETTAGSEKPSAGEQDDDEVGKGYFGEAESDRAASPGDSGDVPDETGEAG